MSKLDVECERFLIKLRLTRGARFHFNHGGVLMGLLCRAMRTHDLPPGVMPFACESGRVRIEGDESYHIGLTLAGAARQGFDVGRFGDELASIGARPPDPNQPLPTLAGNFEVASIEVFPTPDLSGELARLKDRRTLTLRFLSPFRLERPSSLKAKGAGYLNRDCFPPEHFVQRLAKRLFLLVQDRYPEPRECDELVSLLGPPGEASADSRHLLWLDIPLDGTQSKQEIRPKGYTVGGCVGRVRLEGVPEGWLAPLVSGQHLHAGEKTHYGLGRYRIEECGTAECDPFRPARTMFEGMLDASLLQEALSHVAERSVAAGIDGYAPKDYDAIQDLIAAQVVSELQTGTYRPSPLMGFVAAKDKGRLRPLAIPTVRDRMAQRAACVLMTPAIEALLEDCSYAYRKGFSRAGAVRAIERAYEDGYRYVLDADIESFFDAVEWERLFGKLEALFPFEPLTALVKEWVKAPVSFERTIIQREQGLPQGTAISPLLANLYLDEFDEELLGRDYRLVRYGDDFVVLCRDLETAQRAREDARRKLAEMGLSLSEEKTAVRSFDEGFNYLGYLFCRALVLESKREDTQLPTDLAPDSIPPASWLAQVPFERVRALVWRETSARQRTPVAAVELHSGAESRPPSRQALRTPAAIEHKRPLYVVSFDTMVRREADTLVVCAPGQEPQSLPIRALSHVMCYGKVRITVSVLLALSEQGIPTYFCRRSGELRAVFGAPPADWQLWMAQAALAGDEAARVGFAREVVAAKLHNFAALAVRFKLARAEETADELRELERSCENKTTLDALNGLEGRGAALYFGAMRETLDAGWNFEGRRTQPPTDPINAMLSFGYTLLYHQLSTVLLTAGLNPRIGLYHSEHGAYHALACDLQEEFRHLVDAQVWALINRREIRPTDFHASEDGRYPCLLNDEPRRKFIAAFEKRLSAEFTPLDGEATTYRAFMERQARRVKELVCGRVARYGPLRTRGRQAAEGEGGETDS
jgi:CRISPR-associated protein Cas1